MLLICTPILLPMMIKLGVDPIHFGMIMLINLASASSPRRWARRCSWAAQSAR